MGYYQGDYYRGDYYRGDPGFLKKVGGAIVGGVKGMLTGGPLGAIKGAVTAIAKPTAATNLPALRMPGPMITPGFAGPGGKQGVNVPATMGVPEPGFKGGVQRALPFGETGYGAAPAGYHINKAYARYLRAAAAGKNVTDPFSAPRAVNLVVKNRHMNPLNPRALRASVRRQRGAVGLMRGVLAGTGYTIQRRGLGAKRGKKR